MEQEWHAHIFICTKHRRILVSSDQLWVSLDSPVGADIIATVYVWTVTEVHIHDNQPCDQCPGWRYVAGFRFLARDIEKLGTNPTLH